MDEYLMNSFDAGHAVTNPWAYVNRLMMMLQIMYAKLDRRDKHAIGNEFRHWS